MNFCVIMSIELNWSTNESFFYAATTMGGSDGNSDDDVRRGGGRAGVKRNCTIRNCRNLSSSLLHRQPLKAQLKAHATMQYRCA